MLGMVMQSDFGNRTHRRTFTADRAPGHACLGFLACTRSGNQQTLDAVMLCAREAPPPLATAAVVDAPIVGHLSSEA
jgi:hypothetical protein